MLFCCLTTTLMAEEAKQNRGLFAFVNGDKIQVSWRMRATDDPITTQYQLFANNKLIKIMRSKTTVLLSKASYSKATFKLVVRDKYANILDEQDGVKAVSVPYLDIPLKAPVITDPKDGSVAITYTPGDCSAYDMDGDGEQEIILKWMPSALAIFRDSNGNNISGGGIPAIVGNEFYDCYKLDGTRLWRIDMGQNCNAGNNAAFMCWDFDGDGKGEMMVKSAPGTKDATGKYVGFGLPGYTSMESNDLNTYYYRGSDALPTKGEEWMTVFSSEGKELATTQYWPYFGIQNNWYPGSSDTYTYGRRGCSQKGGVAKVPCKDGVTRPCYMAQRGAYSYVYVICYSWDGKELKEEWRHTSDKNGQGLFAEGAHPSVVADLDGDGYDELCVGAAAIDHDGSLLWRTGLGHGDAVHVGELNPDNPGLEMWRITEGATKYDASMHDAKTGKVLNGLLYTKGDVGRGVAMDIDTLVAGNEYFCMTYNKDIYDCNGNRLGSNEMAKNTGYPNYRVFWDGDLTDNHLSGSAVTKYFRRADGSYYSSRCSTPAMTSDLLWKLYQVSSINDTKENPCLQCDLFGDFREELVFFTDAANMSITDKAKYNYALRILTTTWDTKKKLPWLRDDNTYNMQIASQNVGYSMPPHLGYNAYAYDKELGPKGKDEANPKGDGSEPVEDPSTSVPGVEIAIGSDAPSVPLLITTPDGAPSNAIQHGINIVRFSDGTVRKIVSHISK